ncbi:transporter substrate-binding domain-containing protein [Vibrio sp. SCSIO 43136]|uniref:substrate-binding periplasmic protein n=1 Tax=Vibrio sp. SCSIO 43136 TaxID=2819101 RepID=UPI002075B7CC|nr:transporter substrate-binding domain-containing protein [Vibrio sp. SCSIO 43136]USD64618.1 transporter substrate-binding domain-containing protein [Vibrio sp. SCSIO 43136]
MKRKLGSMLVMLLIGNTALAQNIILATHDLAPYGSYPPGSDIRRVADDRFKGIAVDRLRCAMEGLNQNLQVLVVPWRRAQHLAESHQVDGFFAGSQNDYRDSYAVMSEQIADQNWQWYWMKSPTRDSAASIDKSNLGRIGAFQGSNMAKWLEANQYPIFSRPKTTEQLLLQLKIGRVDTVIANNLVVDALLEEYGWKDLVATKIAKEKPLGVYFTKHFLNQRPKAWLDEFNQSLSKCIK